MAWNRSLVAGLVLAAACQTDGSAGRGDSIADRPADDAWSGSRTPVLERVGDVAVVQLYAEGFERLPLEQKKLAWHLYQAALAGRDIAYQQKCSDGLLIRDLCEGILTHADGVDPATLDDVRRYTKLLWINSSPYDARTSRKFVLRCGPDALVRAVQAAARAGARIPKRPNETLRNLIVRLSPILFDELHEPVLTVQRAEGIDAIEASAVTFYADGLTAAELEGIDERYPLNSSLVRTPSGTIAEAVWRAGDPWTGIPEGLYAASFQAIIGHLTRAAEGAPGPTRAALQALVRFYRTGESDDRIAYDIAWMADASPAVDTANGFVAVDLDPRGLKGTWGGLVCYRDPDAAAWSRILEPGWLAEHLPPEVRLEGLDPSGASPTEVVIAAGALGPLCPVAIVLPRDSRVRERHGSKAFDLANVREASETSSRALCAEFAWDDAEAERASKWGSSAGRLLASLSASVARAPASTGGDLEHRLAEYESLLATARADLIALYLVTDHELGELGLFEDAEEVGRAACEQYVREGGLLQLRRVPHGDELRDERMRSRQLVVRWIQADSGAVEERAREGEHYLGVRDVDELHASAGRLLVAVDRMWRTGDREAAEELFEAYGTRFDPALRDEVVARCDRIGWPAQTAFVMPRLTALRNATGEIADVRVSYPLSLEQQMLEWSGRRAPPMIGESGSE